MNVPEDTDLKPAIQRVFYIDFTFDQWFYDAQIMFLTSGVAMDEISHAAFVEMLEKHFSPNKEIDPYSVLGQARIKFLGIPEWRQGDKVLVPAQPGSLSSCRIFRKDQNLKRNVELLIAESLAPVVDDRLQVVIGTKSGGHELIRGFLYGLYARIPGDEYNRTDPGVFAYPYITKGYGYYLFWFLGTYRVIVGRVYKDDALDRELFAETTVIYHS